MKGIKHVLPLLLVVVISLGASEAISFIETLKFGVVYQFMAGFVLTVLFLGVSVISAHLVSKLDKPNAKNLFNDNF
jgi:hypothetical protein